LDGHEVDSYQPVALYQVQELACLLVSQRTYLYFVYLRRILAVRYVAWY
jgi:hypothetical protein